MRNFQKLKTIEDYTILDAPESVENLPFTSFPSGNNLMILRMLVKPKYGSFVIPSILKFLERTIHSLHEYDMMRTGIRESWCYVTIRHGIVSSKTDDEWHFDGSSFRTDIIPERNYIYVNNNPTEYKTGRLSIPDNFDPIKHNLFTFAEKQLESEPIKHTARHNWYLLSPFVLHRRPKLSADIQRTFYRICFTDIEGRDINNTNNPLLDTPFYGRDPVKTFRNNLKNFY